MDIMEKVEQLRAHANISFEEARTVLEEAGGDLLEAVILLERQGKIKKPETELIKMETEDAEQSTKEATGKEAGKATTGTGKRMGKAVKKIVAILKNNSFTVSRNGNQLFMMPAWVFALALLFTWKYIIPAMLISLFFDVRYAFTGTDDLSEANSFMDKVGDMADEVKNEFKPA